MKLSSNLIVLDQITMMMILKIAIIIIKIIMSPNMND